MKNIAKSIIHLLTCLLASHAVLLAQTASDTTVTEHKRFDPNEAAVSAGVNREYIELLCEAAAGSITKSTSWGLHPVMELVFMLEEKPYPDYESPEVAKQDFVDMWEQKYSKVYCDLGPNLRTTLDAISLYHEQDSWVFALYSKNKGFGADINRVMYLDHRIKKLGTLLDYVEYLQNGDSYKVKTDSSFGIDVLNMYKNKISSEKMNGKRMNELSESEKSGYLDSLYKYH